MGAFLGIAAQRDIAAALISGLKALEYRGYDSAGMALHTDAGLRRLRTRGKAQELELRQSIHGLRGSSGIAHTHWATHGAFSVDNAHPYRAGKVAVVHNGIVDNLAELRLELEIDHGRFYSQSEAEVIAHLIERGLREGRDLLQAVRAATTRLEGSYAIVAMSESEPGVLVGVCSGSPLVLGLGDREHYLASDAHALAALTRRVVDLDDGDLVRIGSDSSEVSDREGRGSRRDERELGFSAEEGYRGHNAQFMHAEIHEQVQAIGATLHDRLDANGVAPDLFGPATDPVLAATHGVHIVACGSSLHAAMIARHWIEAIAGLPCQAETASEFRYRDLVVSPGTLFVSITPSGETSDTLAALRVAQQQPYLARLTICNAPGSSAVRESELTLMTQAGPEIGPVSTKAFTTQLTALALLALELARVHRRDPVRYDDGVQQLRALPTLIERALALEAQIAALAYAFVGLEHAWFLGRGTHFPIALEGALKLKEVTHIHAEGHAAGELKHGPLTLVCAGLPVVAVAANDHLLGKLGSNLREVQARGAQVFLFSDEGCASSFANVHLVPLPACGEITAPIVASVPLQLLAYHIATLRHADVDSPLRLARWVAVR